MLSTLNSVLVQVCLCNAGGRRSAGSSDVLLEPVKSALIFHM